MKDIELLPCPFCGSDDLAYTGDDHDSEFIECMECGWQGPTAKGYLAASEAWNRRAAASIGQQKEGGRDETSNPH